MDDLNGLLHLDRFVHEVLRLHSLILRTIRVAIAADEIPCAVPWVDKNGQRRSTIRVTKGDSIAITIAAPNRSRKMWGADALEFNCLYACHRPELLKKAPGSVMHIPGIWGHQLSFPVGPCACISYRFSLAECTPFRSSPIIQKTNSWCRIKALLYVLVCAFEFELTVPPPPTSKRSCGCRSSCVRWCGRERRAMQRLYLLLF